MEHYVGRTVELSRLRQLACLFAPPKTFCTYHKPYVRKKYDSQQVGFNDLFYRPAQIKCDDVEAKPSLIEVRLCFINIHHTLKAKRCRTKCFVMRINYMFCGTVELSRRSVAQALPFCKECDMRKRSALVICYK